MHQDPGRADRSPGSCTSCTWGSCTAGSPGRKSPRGRQLEPRSASRPRRSLRADPHRSRRRARVQRRDPSARRSTARHAAAMARRSAAARARAPRCVGRGRDAQARARASSHPSRLAHALARPLIDPRPAARDHGSLARRASGRADDRGARPVPVGLVRVRASSRRPRNPSRQDPALATAWPASAPPAELLPPGRSGVRPAPHRRPPGSGKPPRRAEIPPKGPPNSVPSRLRGPTTSETILSS